MTLFGCLALLGAIFFGLDASGQIEPGQSSPAVLLIFLPVPLYFWMNVCLVVKRWHDRGNTGWMYLVRFIPFIGFFWTLFACGFGDGMRGPNQYGNAPR
ncbi:hypothetical protein ABI_43780 [Asticcacaulis biprosthecium C19]|uniref:DUF805 domain-containing protein n=1 Tax=Asticcacaulis biprosthecium C19 TaxID=715226 RepID=F4QT83_9CAUL|nr:hypothetical protein ABI_43780 [Asticcacaulis biprosthecium C19]